MIDHNSSLVNPTLSKCESHEPIPDQPLVEKMVESIPPSFDRTFPVESEFHTTQDILVSSNSNKFGDNPPIPMVQGGDPPIPIMQGGSSPIPMAPPPSTMVTSFDWSRLQG